MQRQHGNRHVACLERLSTNVASEEGQSLYRFVPVSAFHHVTSSPTPHTNIQHVHRNHVACALDSQERQGTTNFVALDVAATTPSESGQLHAHG